MTVEELQVLITANSTALQKEISKTNKTVEGLKKTANKTQAGVTSAFSKLKNGIVALGIGKIISDSITIGINSIETESKFGTVLGNISDEVNAWATEVSDALGLNLTSMQGNIATIYSMTSAMGVANKNALTMSKGVSLLAEDLASFHNINSTEAFNKLRAGLTGETEPLKALGILVDENTIKQYAYSEGIAQTGAELTNDQKVLARYVAILRQTGDAQGDLARTINSPANQLRILKNQVRSLAEAFGNLLMPVLNAVLPYITAFTKVVTYALTSLAKFLGISGSSSSSGTSKEIADISSGIADTTSGLDNANKSAKKLKGTLAGFDEMNVLQDNSTDTTGDSGGTSGVGGTGVSGLDFDLGEYDAHLDGLTSKVDEIVEKMKSAFLSVKDVLNSVWETAKSIWNSEPVQAWVGVVTSYGQFIFDFYSQLGSTFVENMKLTWSNIEGNVGITISNITTLWTNMWTDLQAGIDTWGQPIIDGVTGVFNSIWKDAIDPAIQLITQVWADFSGILVDLWNEHGSTLINNIGEFVTNTIALFQRIWDDVINPIITPFLDMLSWLWEEHLKGMVEELGDLVGSVINGALEIYNKFIYPIINWLIKKLAPAWTKLTSGIVNSLGTIIAVVVDVIAGIIRYLKGIINFIVGVFTGNWEKAWDGVKDIFGGIWDALKGVVKGVINTVIDILNSFVDGINKIKFDVPDWVPVIGGKKWGFDVPRIPKLARGGVVDSPTIAQIGEAGKEVVMPLERNTGWIDQLAEKINSKGNGDTPIQLTVKLGEDTIFNKFIEYTRSKDFETNGEVFDI